MGDLSGMKIHIIGIGGTGMAPIAVVLHEMGVSVTGSDRAESDYTQMLRSRGISVMIPQKSDNIGDPDYVFYSSAIHDENPELKEARKKGIPALKRREFLRLMLNERKIIAIAGSHGKSTTTSMTAWVFSKLGLEPGFIIGSSIKDLGKNATAGNSDWFIIEADEYDNMFLGLDPYAACLTKVEYDHPDCFPTQEKYLESFSSFLANTKVNGAILMNGDDPEQKLIALPEKIQVYRYGWDRNSDFYAADPEVGENGCYTFGFCGKGAEVKVRLQIPGKHNVSNAMLVLSLCAVYGLDLQKAADALETFHGIGRRFEITEKWNNIILVDDYAHHPTEIKATLAAARDFFQNRKIWAVWQPHTYSRTNALLNDFSRAFANADEVIITDIYAARETFSGFGIDNVLSAMCHSSVHHKKTNEEIAEFLAANLKSGDVVVTLSAGDANKAAPMALEIMKNAAC